jgi:cbb3-type cytochrome oxidase subunit 3
MSKELLNVLIEVLKSWQVLAVTGVLILYFFLVFYAARGRRRPDSPARTINAGKARKGPAPSGEPDVETPEGNDLGLTEE